MSVNEIRKAVREAFDEDNTLLAAMNAQVESKTEQLTVLGAGFRIAAAMPYFAGSTLTLEEHNRIVAQTITAMDAERVSFEQEIERLKAERDELLVRQRSQRRGI